MIHNTVVEKFKQLPFLIPPNTMYTDETRLLNRYFNGLVVDRSGTIKDTNFPNVVIESFIPTSITNPGDFSQISDKEAANILKQSIETNLPIAVMYSGGLDSTNVVCAFLKQNIKITVIGSQASIDENPTFYNNVLVNNSNVTLIIGNPLRFAKEHLNEYLLVTGECGANIMGPIFYAFKSYSSDMTEQQWNDCAKVLSTPDLLSNVADEQMKKKFLLVLDRSPKTFKTNYDAQWWVRYCLIWQFTANRMQMYFGEYHSTLINFFKSKNFENWALYNDSDVKCPNFNRDYYKMPMRDYIYNFCHDKKASYDMPKRPSIERTYPQLNYNGRYVLDNPRIVGSVTLDSHSNLNY